MNYSVIIPARYGSTRLPGKPLLDIAGKPMIQWVYEQACKSGAQRVVVATDDGRVAAAACAFDAEVCLTRVEHESGTDRLCEAASAMGMLNDHIVVNVQGDEPLLPPVLIDQVAANLVRSKADMATLSVPITEVDELLDPNAVKVVADQQGFALYFSRAPIPWPRDEMAQQPSLPKAYAAQRHIGIYAYRVSFLKSFVTWPLSPLEATEKLEQLRALSQGRRIHVAPAVEAPAAGVDTAADLARVQAILAAGAH